MKEPSEDKQRADHLWNIGNLVSKICPPASRYYLYNFEKNIASDTSMFKNPEKITDLYCNHCGNLWTIHNHKVEVKPPPKPCGYIKALLRKFKTDPLMNKKERKKVIKFLEKQQTKIVYTCFVCKKKTEKQGIEKPGRQILKGKTYNPTMPKPRVRRDYNAGLLLMLKSLEDPGERSVGPLDSTESKITSSDDPLDSTESRITSSELPSTPSNPTVKSPRSDNSSKHTFTPSSYKTPVSLKNQSLVASNKSTAQKSSKKKQRSLSSLSSSLEEQKTPSNKKKSLLTSFLVSL